MQIKAEEISQIIKGQIKEYESKVDLSETGTVISVGDGIARVHGVENCMAMELLEFPGGILGLALNLEEDNVGWPWKAAWLTAWDSRLMAWARLSQRKPGRSRSLLQALSPGNRCMSHATPAARLLTQ
jgi:hypothetical protein